MPLSTTDGVTEMTPKGKNTFARTWQSAPLDPLAKEERDRVEPSQGTHVELRGYICTANWRPHAWHRGRIVGAKSPRSILLIW